VGLVQALFFLPETRPSQTPVHLSASGIESPTGGWRAMLNLLKNREILTINYLVLLTLFIAGYDTSKNVFTFMMHEMTRHPDIYRKCGEDIDYCRKTVEEFLRYFNPSHSFRFTDTEKLKYGALWEEARPKVMFSDRNAGE
jgi:hypothetical protein